MTKARRIPVSELRIGMHIEALGVLWPRHPFARGSFTVTTLGEIAAIKDAGLPHVLVSEGKDLSRPALTPRPRTTPLPPSVPSSATPAPSATALSRLVQEESNDPTSVAAEVFKARRICAEAKETVMSMFEEVRLGRAIDPKTVLPLVQGVADSIQRNPVALISVARLKTHDDYTYLHSVAVCALMIGLTRQLGLDERSVLLAGAGGLMHDLGKAAVPLDILNKPGKLTDSEFDLMRRHSVAGSGMLKEAGAPLEVQDVALYHHEKMIGGGYPIGLVGDDIPLWARMGAVCDVYDAITSERPYKHAWNPADAIRNMANWNGHFDPRLFSAFVKSIGIYPVGSLVRLTSNELAVVIEPGSISLLKPQVRVFFSIPSNRIIPDTVIDLAADGCDIRIVGPEDPSQWGFPHLETLWQ
ncbi:HD-GYP domain-containing protein [Pararobbsia silviterrae]|uniref:HD-GYP domain-containing protein n=1 Tax=Pararobbsia silviterrae TaxID=1792498 RepID=A0A494XZA4_9BURK|nr:HD-GYP domain-containing protein [Pararobbsia silviterrae]RKP53429.1 HD-GYP domain-containing protein [Pararobbsia silviterrae]